MLCFEWIGDPSTEIVLCEEVVRYNPHRAEGINIGVNMVVTPKMEGGRYIYGLHRRAIDELTATTFEDWLSENPGCPYRYLFKNIIRDRLVDNRDGTHNLKLFREEEELNQTRKIKILGKEKDGFDITYNFDLPPAAHAVTPYTCIKIGPFPEEEQSYLFSFHCKIVDSSFDDLICEDISTGTRTYKLYGPNHVHSYIETVDIPKALSFPNRKEYEEAIRFFQAITDDHRLLPLKYSIVVVDHPSCTPARIRSLSLTDNLHNISSQIDPILYNHLQFDKIRGRILWFVCDELDKGFFLQLVGPMALSEIKGFATMRESA
jgi:hypothetical protein